MSPRGGVCDHRNCDGGPCKQLTDEELAPTPANVELATRLIAEGWLSVSTKYRMVRRWRVPPPTPENVVAPEFRGTYFGEQLIKRLYFSLRTAPPELVETMELTLREWRAFKQAGGRCD